MDSAVAGVASESSVPRPKRASDLAGPSKLSGLIEHDHISRDESLDDFEDLRLTGKRKRGPNVPSSEFADHTLIDIIKSNGKLIPNAVKQLVDKYDSDPKSVLAEILMMLFEACGAKYPRENASLDKTNVIDVVSSLVNLARNGKLEDNCNSKKKELKNFKTNLALFWDKLVLECKHRHLCDEFLFKICMDYLIALSCTSPRIYRQVALLVCLQLVNSFIDVAKKLGSQRDTAQTQLDAAKGRKNGPPVKSLDKKLHPTQEMVVVIEDMMRKIVSCITFQDVDPVIRMSCIKSLGGWIISYPTLFFDIKYLEFIGGRLNDINADVRKMSVRALQNLYEVYDYVTLREEFTKKFCDRMIELVNDIDNSVAVSAIGLLKKLSQCQLLPDDKLDSLFGLLTDKRTKIRHAIGALVYDHTIAQNVKSSQSGPIGGDAESSKVHLGRFLQFLQKLPDDPISHAYVIDDVWEDMNAMKDWNVIVLMLLDETPLTLHSEVDATNLVRLLRASAKKAVGENIVPRTDDRKPQYTKAKKEELEKSRHEITIVMMNRYKDLLQKYSADKAKVSSLVDIVLILKLELFSQKRQSQKLLDIIELVTVVFFKHGEKETLRSCIAALSFCSSESQAELRDNAQNKLMYLENELISKLKRGIRELEVDDVEYTLLVNLKRLYELQLSKNVSSDGLFEDLASIFNCTHSLDEEVIAFILLNMHLHVVWCLENINGENTSESSVTSLLSKRTTLFKHLEYYARLMSIVQKKRRSETVLSYRVCGILADAWCFFNKSNYTSTRLECLGYCPDTSVQQKYWKLCEQLINVSDEEDANGEYIEEINRVVVVNDAANLVATNAVRKDYLGHEIISHFVMHGASITEIIEKLITDLKISASDEIPVLFFEALKRAYNRHAVDPSGFDDESSASKSLSECRNLATRLSGTFVGQASGILKIVNDGILFAFLDAPKQLSFLNGAVLPFVSKLPGSVSQNILEDVKRRSENVNTDEDPSGWSPYYTFIDKVHKKCAMDKGLPGANVQGGARSQS